MAHGITEQDNMFSVRTRPWHGLGNVLEDAPCIDEAIKQAGLCWDVKLEDLQRIDNKEIVSHKAVIRQDTKDTLGIVGPNYAPLQNNKAFEWFEPFLKSGQASLECGGSLFGGKKVFVLAKINKDPSVIVPGANDIVDKYVLLSNSHDGSSSIRVGFTPIRVVCNNTLSFAHSSVESNLIRIRHTKSAESTLLDVQDTMNLINEEFEATAEQYRYLATKDINKSDLEKYIKQVFEVREDAKRKTSIVDDVTELFETGRGNYLPGVRGTAWAAYNAITEQLSHYQKTRGSSNQLEGRYNSLWFGQNKDRNKKALELALAL